MKKCFFIWLLTALLVLNTNAQYINHSIVRVMAPADKSALKQKDDCVYFIEVNGVSAGALKPHQYVDIKLKPGNYQFSIYRNVTPKGTKLPNIFMSAKLNGVALRYDTISVGTSKTYYLDVMNDPKNYVGRESYLLATSQKTIEAIPEIDLTNTEFPKPTQPANLAAAPKTTVTPSVTTTSTPLAKQQTPDPQPIVAQTTPAPKAKGQSMVDVNIPSNPVTNDSTFVLIIANENYEFVGKVNCAVQDGRIFKEYCAKTLGVPGRQIFYYENATAGKMEDGISKLTYCLKNFKGARGIVYYCGHGIPDEKTNAAYLIPTDGKGTNSRTCYSVQELYKTLAATNAQSITYFMDACFTGSDKEGSMLVAARGVARAPERETLEGKTVVFSASSGDETAMTLKDEGHGLFTYYLLKKLQETKGDVTYGDLADYLHYNVMRDAFLINEKPQTPVVATSPAVVNTWKTMKLK